MAKMLQDTLVISVSKLLRDDGDQENIITPEILDQIEAILAELVSDTTAMIEVTKVASE